jgi:hypothetical protein
MYGVALLLTVAAVGVEYGWQPGEDGQLEYIIQIEPELVKTLSEGKVDLLSEIPEELQGVKRFRIRVGTEKVPRIGLDPAATASALKPGDSPANKQPNLNAPPTGSSPYQTAGDPRAPTKSPTQGAPGKVLSPPSRSIPDPDPTLPGGDRYTDSGSSFPAIGTRPGISRTPTQPADRFGRSEDTSFANDMDPIPNTPRSPATNPNAVWDSKTNQWRTPTASTPGTNPLNPPGNQQEDPRYQPNDPRYAADDRSAPATGSNGLPEVRRDNVTDPRDPRDPRNAPPPSAYGQYQPPPAGAPWGPPNYVQPLQDPDRGYYYGPYAQQPPPGYYNPNLPPMNRQVGYQVAANPAPAPTNTTGTTPTTNSSNENSSASSATNSTATKAAPPAGSRGPMRDDDAVRPWWPLTFTAILLFASIGLNFYLGWIAHGVYQRYRALLMEVRNVRAATI